MSIEELDPKDWLEYLTLRSQLGGYYAPMEEEDFIKKYTMMKGEIFVMKKKQKMVGTFRLIIIQKFNDNVAWLDDVVVDSEHRKQGYGKQMLLEAIKISTCKKCYKLITATRTETVPFYTSVGMYETGSELTLKLL